MSIHTLLEGKQSRPNLSNERLAELAREQGEHVPDDLTIYGDDGGTAGGMAQTLSSTPQPTDDDGGVHVELTGEQPAAHVPPADAGDQGGAPMWEGMPFADGVQTDPNEVAGFYKTPVVGRDEHGNKIVVGWNAKYDSPEAMEQGLREAQQAKTAAEQRAAELERQQQQALTDAGEHFAPADFGDEPMPQFVDPMTQVAGEVQTIAAIQHLSQSNPQEAALAAMKIGRGDLYDRIVGEWEESDPEGARQFDRQMERQILRAEIHAELDGRDQAQQQQVQQQQHLAQVQQQSAETILNEAQAQFFTTLGVKDATELDNLAQARMTELWNQRPELHAAAGSSALLAATWHSLYQEARQQVGAVTAAGGQQRLAAHQQQQLAGAHVTTHSASPAAVAGQPGEPGGAAGVQTYNGVESPESVMAGILAANRKHVPFWRQ